MSDTPAIHDNRATLQGLRLQPVLANADDINPHLAAHGDFPRHKYEKIIVHGFTTRMSTDQIVAHPLIRLLHDYKHLVLHGNRGDKTTRDRKRKSKKPFENHFCRLSFVYTLAQNPDTFDLTIKFVVDTAFRPIWTNYDGSRNRDMTPADIAQVTANFIESYLAEAESLIQSETASCRIDSTTVVELSDATNTLSDANPDKITTPPQKPN